MKLITAGGLILASATAAAAAPDAKISYTYPAQVRAIPALREWMDKQAAALRVSVAHDAANDKNTPAPYESQRTWKVVADTPRFLSLSQERYDYTGGAHGLGTFSALIYDRQTGKRLTAADFFTSSEALRAAIKVPFCRQLDAERARKRADDPPGTQYLPDFKICPDPVEEAVIIGSSRGGRFDRLGVLLAPYDAGPYAEGSYETSLPVTPAVLAALKPEYRAFFMAGPGAR